METKIWEFKKENGVINVLGVSKPNKDFCESRDEYYIWNFKLANTFEESEEIYIARPAIEEIIIGVRDNTLTLVENNINRIQESVKRELWRNRLHILLDFGKDIKLELKKELNEIFPNSKLEVVRDSGLDNKWYEVVESDAKDNKWYEVIESDVKDNKLHLSIDPSTLIDICGSYVAIKVLDAIIKDVTEPLHKPISNVGKRGIEKGLRGIKNIKDKLRREKSEEETEELMNKAENIVFIEKYRKKKYGDKRN